MDNVQSEILELIVLERKKQDAKWGKRRHDHGTWMLILQEEIGEIAQAVLKESPVNLVRELVQATAVLVAWLEFYVGSKEVAQILLRNWEWEKGEKADNVMIARLFQQPVSEE